MTRVFTGNNRLFQTEPEIPAQGTKWQQHNDNMGYNSSVSDGSSFTKEQPRFQEQVNSRIPARQFKMERPPWSN